MAIKFFNIRSKEVQVAETEPQISAMWSSSDHSPNITQGQDFGWRLAPEVVVEMKRIKQDYDQILNIAKRYNMLPEDVGETTILQFISDKTDASAAPIAQDADYSDEYHEEIRRLERESEPTVDQLPLTPAAPTDTPQTATTTTTQREETIEELEARLAAKKAEAAASTTTTTQKPAPTTTTTTTKKQ